MNDYPAQPVRSAPAAIGGATEIPMEQTRTASTGDRRADRSESLPTRGEPDGCRGEMPNREDDPVCGA